MTYAIRKFDELTTRDLFEIYLLRSRIFVVEQNCAYQDVDEKDLEAYHVLITDEKGLMGYCRILPPTTYPNPRIGRVVVELELRNKGVGREIMKYSINKCKEYFNNQDIIISAQKYLLNFYESLGFETEGEEYLEDNIPHIKMRYKFPTS